MRPRSLILLAVVVAALAAFIALYERRLPSSEERSERRDRVVPVEAADVTGVILERRGGETVELRRAESGEEAAGARRDESIPEEGTAEVAGEAEPWRLVAPFPFRADESEVGWLVDTLTGLRHERVLESFDAARLGLAPPRARVTLITPEAESSLLVGKAIPGYASLAIQVEGHDEALVVSDAVWQQLSRAPGEWRSREVVPVRGDEIARIAWSLDGERFALGRRDGELQVVAPYEDRADASRVDALLAALTSLRVDRFVDTADGAPALGEASKTVRLQWDGQREPFELQIAKADEEGELRLRFAGQAAAAKSELMDRLAGPATVWRSRDLSSLELWRIERATLRDAQGSLTLARTDGAWTRDDVEVSFNVATDLLDAVLDIAADAVRTRPQNWTAPGEPELQLELQGEEEERSETLVLYPGDIATTSQRQVLLELPPGTTDKLRQRVADLRTAEPVPASDD